MELVNNNMKFFAQLLNEDIAVIKSYATKSGKTEKEVEKLWNEIKQSTKKAHPDLTEKDSKFWKIVNGTVKKILKINT